MGSQALPSARAITLLATATLFTCFSMQSSQAEDSLKPLQQLADGQTLVSAAANFELGFFERSRQRYIGIWYKNPGYYQTVVWVANPDRPITSSTGVLMIDERGRLFITDGDSSINYNLTADFGSNNVSARLLDSGNLQLRDGSSGNGRLLWQSFDHPTDTILPGMKIGKNIRTGQTSVLVSQMGRDDPSTGRYTLGLGLDQNGEAEVLVSQGGATYWASGAWSGGSFSSVPEMGSSSMFPFIYVSNENERYFTYKASNRSAISRLVLLYTGKIQLLVWSVADKTWLVYWSRPTTGNCDVYNQCGAFGSCVKQKIDSCKCLTGFEPTSPKDWMGGYWVDGCSRRTHLKCGKNNSVHGQGDKFSKILNVRLPANPQARHARSVEECQMACLNLCSCTAYSYGTQCTIWIGDLLNLQQLSDSDVQREPFFLRLAASELHTGSKFHVWIIIVIVIITILFFVSIYIALRRIIKGPGRGGTRKTQGVIDDSSPTKIKDELIFCGENGKNYPALPLFSFASLAEATNNFSDANMLGRGGFGPVYKGKLLNGSEIAVKRLSPGSRQGPEEFKNEIFLIAKVQHINLVRLLGFCNEGEEKMLLYEFMPNGSLDSFIFDATKKKNLDWPKRFHIIKGIAAGLLYLHKYSRLKIIHRDLKASNILLDRDLMPKISDFGMARIFGRDEFEAKTKRVVGTYGYMPPEYIMGGHFSEKSDVFSFGVLLLEIVSGKKNISFYNSEQALTLPGHAWNLWKEDHSMEFIDPVLVGPPNRHDVIRCIHVGLLCVQKIPTERPNLSDVVFMLSSELEIKTFPSPKEPAFGWETAEFIDREPINCSNNEVTISVMDGR